MTRRAILLALVLTAFAASVPTIGELETAAIEAVEKRLAKTATIRVRGFYGMTHHKVSAVTHHKLSAEYWTCGAVGVESKGLSERIPFIVRHQAPDPTVFFHSDMTPGDPSVGLSCHSFATVPARKGQLFTTTLNKRPV